MSKLSKETAEAVTKVMRAAGMPPRWMLRFDTGYEPAQPMSAGKSLTALKYLLGYDPELDAIDVAAQRLRRSQRRLRDAMEGMSNVAACMRNAARGRIEARYAYLRFIHTERRDGFTACEWGWMPTWEQIVSAAQADWSARVRAKVAALPPPGPRVYCANEDD